MPRSNLVKNKTDEKIVDFLSLNPGHSHEVAAQAEMTRRLIKKLNQFIKSSEKYSKRNLILSIALFFIGYTQLIMIIATSMLSSLVKITLFLVVIISICFLTHWLLKNEHKVKL